MGSFFSSSSKSSKKNITLNNVFSYMGNFSPSFYQIDSNEIRNKHSKHSNESWKDVILNKIYNSEESKKNAENLASIYNISVEELAYMLGDKELYLKYLLRPIYNPSEIIESIRKGLEELKKDSNELNDIRDEIRKINKRNKEFSNVNLKFILADMGINKFVIGNIATNICNLFNRKFPYAALHAGLMINESIIQWGTGPFGGEIIFPSTDLWNILFSIETESNKKKEKRKNIFTILKAIAIGSVFGIPLLAIGGPLGIILAGLVGAGISTGIFFVLKFSWDIKKINEDELDKIANKCILYNREEQYDLFDNNCQKFVNDILEDINAPFNPKGELKNVIDKISKNGYSSFSFKGTEFKTRREFDNYVKKIKFKDLCQEDKILILCYKSLYDDRLNIIQKEERQRQLTEEERLEKEKYITDDEDFWNNLLSIH